MKQKLNIGIDFDGVVAYNPFRIIRSPWAYFKRNILGIRKLTFFYPQSNWQRFIWRIVHDSSFFPSRGIDLLEDLVVTDTIELHLVTGRYHFLDDHLQHWLTKHHLTKLFKTININTHDDQPHLFKERMIGKYKFDVFIEDNWDIVEYLHKKIERTKVYWIYNLVDRHRIYPYKYPYLEKALKALPIGKRDK